MVYTVWVVEEEEGTSFTIIRGRELNDTHRSLEPNLRLVRTIEAVSYNDAMQQYYDWQGWGRYRPTPDDTQ